MSTELLDAPTETTDEAPSLRETIEAAIDEKSGQDADGQSTPPAGPATSTEAATTRTVEGVTKPAPDTQPVGQQPAVAPGTPTTPPGTAELKAPTSWKPHVREKWNGLPREVQEEVLRREADTLRLVGSVGQKIRMADEVGQHLQPFAEKLQASGASPSEFLGDVFTTIKSLAAGDSRTKAEVVANIIQSYGVDLRALDSVLSGRLTAPPLDPRAVEAQQRAIALERQVRQYESVAEERTQQTINAHLQQFAADPKNEFFNDVRDMMADLIEVGKANSLEDAYTAAIWANPDTRKILLQREAEQRAAAKQNRANQARRISASVSGAPRTTGVQGGVNDKMSLRESINAAWDAQENAA